MFTLDDGEISKNGVVTKTIKYNTATGGVLIINLKDEPEDDNIKVDNSNVMLTSSKSSNKTGSSSTATKKIGKRYFTGTCYYASGLVTVQVFAENHYTVTGSRNLKERYLTIKDVKGFLYCSNTATQAGSGNIGSTSKIGGKIRYRIHVTSIIGPIPKFGINIITKNYYADLDVKLLKRVKGGVKVSQTMRWEH